MKRVYLDHNATSPLRPAARRVLAAELGDELGDGLLGNPSSAHLEGRRARRLLEDARERIAELLGADREGVVFTSGGSEANAQALSAARGRCVVTTRIEHPSILENLSSPAGGGAATPDAAISVEGLPIWLDLDAEGAIAGDPAALMRGLGDAPALLSVALANHETGVTRDLSVLAVAARERGLVVHTDASQAVGRLEVDFGALEVDLMTLCAHKFGGPAGIGALLLRPGTEVPALIRGGGQEGGLRAGTEPCLLAAAFAAALDEALSGLSEQSIRWATWRDRLLVQLRHLVPDMQLNSPATGGLPNTLNVSFPGRDGSALVHRLDLEGVSVSHGSACASGSLEPSPVILALFGDARRARSAVRFSFGWNNESSDVEHVVEAVSRALRDATSRPSSSSREPS